MTYRDWTQWPEWLQELASLLTDAEQRVLHRPHEDEARGRRIQDGIIGALEDSRTSVEMRPILDQLRGYAREWGQSQLISGPGADRVQGTGKLPLRLCAASLSCETLVAVDRAVLSRLEGYLSILPTLRTDSRV